MSASRNEDASRAVSEQGEFSSRVPRDEPLTTRGHQPGVKASPNDNIPTFEAQTLPAGTAPPSKTFQPNVDADAETAPTTLDAPTSEAGGNAKASDTITGATSADVHTGLGHPGQGQSSAEIRHDGEQHRKKQGLGLAGQASELDS